MDGQTKGFIQFVKSQAIALCDAGASAAVLRKLLGPHPSSMQVKAGLAVSELSKHLQTFGNRPWNWELPGLTRAQCWKGTEGKYRHRSPLQAARAGAVNLLLLYNQYLNSQAREDLTVRELNRLILYRFFL